MARLAILLAALATGGCYVAHDRDGGTEVDARVATDAPEACVAPRGGNCCCQGDELGMVLCDSGRWSCEPGYSYHEGFECSPRCGGPCSLPCPPDAGVELVMCNASPAVFPVLDRSCDASSDCAIAEHQTDCCGSIHVMGIATRERARFDALEATCRAQYPGCGCAGGMIADDGTTPASGPMPYVTCEAGTCTTSYFIGG